MSKSKPQYVAGAAMFSSKRDDWATPPALFAELNAEFGFTLDPCCKVATAKCDKFFAIDRGDDGLAESWQGETVFMNPPYGKSVSTWMERAYRAAREEGATVVALVPCSADTGWWHEHVLAAGAEVRFVKGRVRFFQDGRPGGHAPFASAVVIYRPENIGQAPSLGSIVQARKRAA